MDNKYVLKQRIINPCTPIYISEDRFYALNSAMTTLIDGLAFEQKYELLLGNFMALELEMTEICLNLQVMPTYSYKSSSALIEKVNRCMVNLLTSIRGYSDQVVQDFKHLAPSLNFKDAAKNKLSNLWDTSADYKLMYALRNHVQHKAMAVHGFSGNDMSVSESESWVSRTMFTLTKETLEADKDFKKSALANQPDKIDVRRLARSSVRGLGAVHMQLRDIVQPSIEAARTLVEGAIAGYLSAGNSSAVGLTIGVDGDIKSAKHIMLDWDDVRIDLASKNIRPLSLWPNRRPGDPRPEDVRHQRDEAGHSVTQAAKLIFVSDQRWRDYEEGLPMPKGLFQLYQIKAGLHPSHHLA
ncbi:hypothetical protein [Stenotrophomonas geniculata]